MTPEKCMAMMLKTMAKIAEADQNAPVHDCVLSVPAYFTDAERHAMLDAAKIVGLNVLRLMHDTTAGTPGTDGHRGDSRLADSPACAFPPRFLLPASPPCLRVPPRRISPGR